MADLIVDYASVDGNQPPDVAKAAAYGIKGAYVRAAYTYGGVALPDTHCARDAKAWRSIGKFGAYLILGWKEPDVLSQITRFVRAYDEVQLDMPVALDLEADSAALLGMTPQQCLDRAEYAYKLMAGTYGTVMVYTSCRVWTDVFGNLPSATMGDAPLWLKVPYAWKAGNPPHLECAEPDKVVDVPRPWRGRTPLLKQFQGDARGVPGFTSTVDLNVLPPSSPLLNSGWLPNAPVLAA